MKTNGDSKNKFILHEGVPTEIVWIDYLGEARCVCGKMFGEEFYGKIRVLCRGCGRFVKLITKEPNT